MSLLLQIDKQISLFIASIIPHTVFFDYFFSFLSLKGYALPIWILIIAVLVFFEEKRDKKFILYFCIAFALTAALVSFPLKTLFHRPRPIPSLQLTHFTCPTDFSFPSGHAATAFAAATILAFYDKKRRWFYFGVAALISLSRIYLECHFFLDVLGGALFGIMISKIILLFVKKKPELV
jgi:undecaprenyl-diphosphatase